MDINQIIETPYCEVCENDFPNNERLIGELHTGGQVVVCESCKEGAEDAMDLIATVTIH